MADERIKLAYDEGMRVLAQQRDDLERLRGRVIALASVASVAVGVIGATGRQHLNTPLVIVAVCALVVLVGCVCVILLPRRTIFENDPRVIIAGYVDGGYGEDETYRWLAVYAGDNGEINGKLLNRLASLFAVAALALALLVGAIALSVVVGS